MCVGECIYIYASSCADRVGLLGSGPASTEARGSRIAQGLVGTRLASCSMAELVTEHAEIVARLRRIATGLETSAHTSEGLASQLLECRVALLCQNIGARPKRLARPSHAPSSSFAEVSAARSQARGAERIRDNRFPTRGPESISRSPLQRRRIHKWRKDLTLHRDNMAEQLA